MRRAGWPAIVAVALSAAGEAAEIRYDRDVRPILAEFCWRCHGPVEADRRGGLRLDDRETATAAAESGAAAIVAGRPEASGLIHRVSSADPDLRMPPPESGKTLSRRQIELLERWIAAGAPFESHWAFRPLERPVVPRPRGDAAAAGDVDRFIFARLEEAGLPIPAPADPAVQFRRLAFTLGGLPPEPAAVRAFAAEAGPEAWRAAIDAGLASTAYGEHMARRWMDVVRYADSAGYELDYLFAHAHRYRDWLIRAFRDGLPLDRFLAAQLAGDERADDDPDGRDAALFLAVGPRRFEGGIQRAEAREQEWLTDVVDTFGSGFLGLTLSCARCHDHKYDPLSQREYFGLQAVFAEARLDERRIGEKGGDTRPAELSVARRESPAVVRVLRRGEVDDPLDEAPPLVPAILRADGDAGPEFTTAGRRAALARWLTSAGSPLVARTFANRIWQWHFGAGLTRTPNDLGVQGEFPSHPELLEWLACELVESGWNLQHLHRLILSSHTFRATADSSAAVREADPDNRLLGRFPRRRLEAEELRDALLAVSGRLDGRAFGPPVVPRVEPWVLAALRNAHWEVTEDPAAARRRTIYLVVRRSLKLPFLDAFNGPDCVSSCGARDTSVVASQALLMLNDETALAAARGLAARAWRRGEGDLAAAVPAAWWLALGREPAPGEARRAREFLAERVRAWEGRRPPDGLFPDAGEAEDGTPAAAAPSPASAAALVEWCHLLLNTAEFCHVE
jgi:hypothetical protein